MGISVGIRCRPFRRVTEKKFQIVDLVFKWDAPKEEKHGKFDHMWKGPYIIASFRGYN